MASTDGILPPKTAEFYRTCIRTLERGQVPFLIGGAYAFGVFTGVIRHTKDLDFFIRPGDVQRALDCFARDGYHSELTFPHWLAKVKCGDDCLDLIFRAGNGLCEIDDSWFARAPRHPVLGLEALLTAPEEMIWMKAYIMERERFDGADVAHLLHSCAESLDWDHLLDRFAHHWRVLLAHLILFQFIYPSDRDRIPAHVLRELLRRAEGADDASNNGGAICRGTLLSRAQYLPDVLHRGYTDARLTGRSHMNADDVRNWTAAIERKDRPVV